MTHTEKRLFGLFAQIGDAGPIAATVQKGEHLVGPPFASPQPVPFNDVLSDLPVTTHRSGGSAPIVATHSHHRRSKIGAQLSRRCNNGAKSKA